MNKASRKSGTALLLFLGWLVYSTSYLGKVNYSANITQIIEFYDITKADAGMVSTFLFITYGIGQVVNGILCKRYNIKWMVFVSLFLSASINLAIAMTSEFAVIKWLWLANGFLLSILWPALVRLLAESLPQRDLEKSSLIMGTTVAVGTLTVYLLSSFFVAINNFKLAFYTGGFAGIIVALIWLMSYKKAVNLSLAAKSEGSITDTVSVKVENKGAKVEKKALLVTIGVICFSAIGVNLIKDGLITWVPSILKEAGSLDDSVSILLTLFLPILAIFGNALAVAMHKKISDYVAHCLVGFGIMAVGIVIVIANLSTKQVVLMMVGLVLANLLASSLNSLITSIFPMFMRESVNSGMCAGVLNGFCYLGSALSSYGLGFVADNGGWSAVFWCLLGGCIAVSVVCTVYIVLKNIIKRRGTRNIKATKEL